MTNMIKHKFRPAFSIVELIVVIAVIAILATIVVVSYGSWRSTTIANQLKSDLNDAAAAMESARTFDNAYPATLPSSFVPSDGVTVTVVRSNGKSYCIEAVSSRENSLKFYIKDSKDGAQVGDCALVVSTLAGSGVAGSTDDVGTSAEFYKPHDIVVDPSGNIYVADTSNHRIRKITPSGVVTTLAGSGVGSTDGTGTDATFNSPDGLAIDSSGNIYVADTGNHRIRKITPSGVVTTFAGSAAGYANGVGTAAQFAYPEDIAIDTVGNVFVSDSNNHRIRKITPSGVVTTFAGSAAGYANGVGTAAQFQYPRGIAIDTSGNLYVADDQDYRIRKISPGGTVTTLAGSGTSGYADGTGAGAMFNGPHGIAVDSSGMIYVIESSNNRIRMITQTGVVTTLAGSGGYGYLDGTGTSAMFNFAHGIAVDSFGVIYIADSNNNRIRVIE